MWYEAGTKSITVTVVKEVTVEEALLLELKKWYKKTVEVPRVSEPYDWSFDVTQTVKESRLLGDVEKAYLYGWYRIEDFAYAGTTKPAERSKQEIVSGWMQGYELALLVLNQSDYPALKGDYGWYWVRVPCKLITFKRVSWDVKVDRTTVAPGDIITVTATINMQPMQTAKFKLKIEAFGRVYETDYVEATTSPVQIKTSIAVPPDVKPGTYLMKITLYRM